MSNKIFRYRKGTEVSDPISEEELIELIREKMLDDEVMIKTRELKEWIRIADSIYEYYFRESDNV